MPKLKTRGQTYYSANIKGTRDNYGWSARFDITDGILGISQFVGIQTVALQERVLLSPNQVKEMLAFLKKHQ